MINQRAKGWGVWLDEDVRIFIGWHPTMEKAVAKEVALMTGRRKRIIAAAKARNRKARLARGKKQERK